MHPHAVAAKVKAYIDMIMIYLYKPSTNHIRAPSSWSPKWVPPPEGTLSINGDAALFASTRTIGVCFVVGDHIGAFLDVCGERCDEVVSPEMAEAPDVGHVVSFTLDEGFSKVSIGSDCLKVIRCIGVLP